VGNGFVAGEFERAERAFTGWMISVFIGNLILARGGGLTRLLQSERDEGNETHEDAETAEFAEKRGEPQPRLADQTWALQRKSESCAQALKGPCTGGQFCRGTLGEFGVKDKQGMLQYH